MNIIKKKVEDESKFLELRKLPDGIAMIMALIFYLGVNEGHDEKKQEASFITR